MTNRPKRQSKFDVNVPLVIVVVLVAIIVALCVAAFVLR